MGAYRRELLQLLTRALEAPIASPGSEKLAHLALAHFEGLEILPAFAEKALETLRDGERHDRLAIARFEPHIAIWFVAWSGTHREAQAERYGHYLNTLAGTARSLVDRGIPIGGLLEIDAYLRETGDSDDDLELDVEYSYLPGFVFGSGSPGSDPLSRTILLNPDLCTPEEKQLLQRLVAPQPGGKP